MNPLLIVGIVAGAFLLGKSGKKSSKTSPPPGAPIPQPVPLPAEGETTADYGHLWDSLTYGVEVYPNGGARDFVPPAYKSASASSGCRTIAVADGWWEEMGNWVEDLVAKGTPHSDIAAAVLGSVPNCMGQDTQATALLKAEVLDRLAMKLDEVDGDSGGLQTQDPDTGIYLSLGSNAHVRKHNKAGVGQHTIVIETSNEYLPGLGQHYPIAEWRAWLPGPVREGEHFRSGKRSSLELALQDAIDAIDGYAVPDVQKNPTPGFLAVTRNAAPTSQPRRFLMGGRRKGFAGKLRGTPRRNPSTLPRR